MLSRRVATSRVRASTCTKGCGPPAAAAAAACGPSLFGTRRSTTSVWRTSQHESASESACGASAPSKSSNGRLASMAENSSCSNREHRLYRSGWATVPAGPKSAKVLPEPDSPAATTAELKPESSHSSALAPAASKRPSAAAKARSRPRLSSFAAPMTPPGETRNLRTASASGVSSGQRGSRTCTTHPSGSAVTTRTERALGGRTRQSTCAYPTRASPPPPRSSSSSASSSNSGVSAVAVVSDMALARLD